MNQKQFMRILAALFAGILTISAGDAAPAPKYSPAGTWEYTAPSAPDGYTQGQMVVREKEDSFGVTIVLNEYARVEAEKVEYGKKSISFVVYVENEEVSINGEFKKDVFNGTVNSSSVGVFDFSATRVKP